jgi:molybdate transport system ATP-binding protein
MSIRAQFTLQRGEFHLQADLSLPAQGVTVLFGPSGSGKTTLLRCMAGLETQAQGSMFVQDRCWQNSQQGLFIPPHQRELGMVFQEASLLSHLDVRRNLEFGLRRLKPAQRKIQPQQAIDLLGISHLLGRAVTQLSGGERQRVAIARALLTSPRLLLMDEPLSALDQPRKQEILPYLERLPREFKIPIIYVSHAIDEVIRLADHLVLLDQGRIVADGTPSATLSRLDLPGTFMDEASVLIEARVERVDPHDHLALLQFAGGQLWVPAGRHQCGESLRVRIHAKDVSIALSQHADSSILNRLPAKLVHFAPAAHPGHLLLQCQVNGTTMVARITQRSFTALGLQAGVPVWLQIKAVSLVQT